MRKLLLPIASFMILGTSITAQGQDLPDYVPTDGLMGWWPFNGNADDASGNANNGINNGAVLAEDRFGHADSAYAFDGSGSYISIPSSASLESPTNRLTMSAWVDLAGFSLTGDPYDPILMKSDNGSNAFMYRFMIDNSGLSAAVNDWTNYAGVANIFPQDQWYMVTAVLDSSVASFYINNTLVATQPFVSNFQLNTLPLEIGRDVPGYTEIFNGKIDDIGIWNRALTEQEVTALYYGNSLGIDGPSAADGWSVHPDETMQQLHVHSNARAVGLPYLITDALGRTVITGRLNAADALINLGDMHTGVYILSIGDTMRQRFTIVRK